MDRSVDVFTVFSAEIESRNGTAVITVPDRELELGELEMDETYRVAIYPQPTPSASSETTPVREPSRAEESPPPVEEEATLDVEIEDVGDQGDGIARIGPGYIVFVPDTDIGDRVTIRITDARENFAFADVIEHEPISD